MLLNGIFAPITTPFYPDARIYYKKLEQNAARYSRTPLSGIVVLGSTGEAVMLGDEERRDVLKIAMESSAPEKVMIAGTGTESAAETLRLTDYAAQLGYDVAMVRTPHFYRGQMQPRSMLAFYRFVADRSPLPVLIYNVPQATAYELPVQVIVELAEHPNIVGIKESSGDFEKVRELIAKTRHVQRTTTVTERFEAATGRMLGRAAAGVAREAAVVAAELVPAAALAGTGHSQTVAPPGKPSSSAVEFVGNIKTRRKSVGFQVLVGNAQQLQRSFESGATGAIVSLAVAAPTACYEIYAAFKDGDTKLAAEKQQRILKAAARVAGDLGVPGLKYAMDLNGYYGGHGRLPLLPVDADTKREIEQLMVPLPS